VKERNGIAAKTHPTPARVWDESGLALIKFAKIILKSSR
jgi:hypothetical protein